MWKYANWNKTIKISITVLIAIVLIVNIFGGKSNSDDSQQINSSKTVSNYQQDTTNTTKETATTTTTTTTTTTQKTMSESEYKNSCKTISFKELSRNPDKYEGNKYKFTGEVIQSTQNTLWGVTIYSLRINVTKTDYGWTDTIYATVTVNSDEDRILEDDVITIWGECDGLYTYESVMGASISLPKIDIEYYTIK